MKNWFLLIALNLGLSLTGFAVTVTVSSPTPNSQVPSPIHVVANASANDGISGWVVYLDSQNVYHAGATNSINTYIPASAGNHQLVVRAWDNNDAYGDVWENISVTGNGGGGGGGGRWWWGRSA